MPTQRPANQNRVLQPKFTDDRDHVPDVRSPGHIRRATFTRPMTALVDSHDAVLLPHPLDRGIPLTGMTGQPMQQHNRSTKSPEVVNHQADPVTDDRALHPTRHPASFPRPSYVSAHR